MASHVADLHLRKRTPQFWLWYGILVGSLAWGADLQISYSLVAHACSTGHHYVLHMITAVSFLFAFSGALVARSHLTRIAHSANHSDAFGENSRFMAILGLGASLFWSVVIIAMAVPRFILSPCD